ncbi:MAG: HAMP domain-containing protein [Oscillospiraceae bacterium]|jgi:signal transduction histidine kinase|nr:HAMP domain-containing protein [Oscillospiraceae bacterium]
MRRGLRTQFSLAVMLLVLLTVALLSVLSNTLIRRRFESYLAEEQRARALALADNLGTPYDPADQTWNVEFIHGVGMSALSDGYIVKVLDVGGGVVWDAQSHDMTHCQHIMAEIVARMEAVRPGEPGRFVSQRYPLSQNGQPIGVADISYYSPFFLQESDFRFLDWLNFALALVGGLALTLAALTGTALARRIARPIAKTADIAKRIAGGQYEIRFEGRPKTRELDELAQAINHLAEALGTQESLRRRLTTDIAHELRTPLTTVSAHLEAILEGVWEATPERLRACHEEVGRLSGVIADLERLNSVDSGEIQLRKAPVDVLEAVRAAAAAFEAEAARKQIALTVEGASLVLPADRDRLGQVLANLLSNAVKYTPTGGHIRVRVGEADGFGVITVEDDGLGIPEPELTLVFERFYRTDKSRSRKTGGAGIGLAVVKAIVVAHGGTVEAQQPPGPGARLVVRLPLTPTSDL